MTGRIARRLGVLMLACGWVLPLLGSGAAKAAVLQAYSFSGTHIGNQTYTGALGNDFTVNKAINVYALGAFDSSPDGITGPIDVHIFNLNDTSTAVVSISIPTADFSQGEYKFKSIAPVALLPGNYSVVAFGFSSVDPNSNENVADIPLITNDGGGLISFVDSRFGAQGVDPLTTFPSTLTVGNFPCDGAPQACFAAGTFTYTAIPEPATLALLGAGLFGMGVAARRRRRKAVH